MEMKFPQGFIYQAATSTYQIYGVRNGDGKSKIICEHYSRRQGNIRNHDRVDLERYMLHLCPVRVDYDTKKRIPWQRYFWYQRVIATNGLEI